LSSAGSGKVVAGCEAARGALEDEDGGGVEGVEVGAEVVLEPVKVLYRLESIG